MKNHIFDVVVVGGGHAGTEAALASARMGAQTLLLTHNLDTLGQMSCNPAIGGIGKGHLVKEIDAMGGMMARAADRAGIHFRVLNSSKGPAVRATRAQTDRMLYKQAVRQALEQQENLWLLQQAVNELIIFDNTITGVRIGTGDIINAHTLILTVGTFLAGTIHVGLNNYSSGRAGEQAAINLAAQLREIAPRTGRLKTGTPPRLDARSINFAVLTKQEGDDPRPVFSFDGDASVHPQQVPCFITHTNEQTHEIIRANLDQSPLYTGVIAGIGPRYCPSIEDKIVRFAERNAHQIFVEPEGLMTHEIYPNGISTSLPFAAQLDIVRSIKGFENAHITRPGYAIEYDFFDPRDLQASLETKYIRNLFFAGQINGTTGYEEAAAQGLVAGINAALRVQGQAAWLPLRQESYIGVMVDDLVTRGAIEPYRMFTSRAEYRLTLREDNADLRLSPLAYKFGLLSPEYWRKFNTKQDLLTQEYERLRRTMVQPNTPPADALAAFLPQPLAKPARLTELLARPELTYAKIRTIAALGPFIDNELIADQLNIQIKYAGYIERQAAEIAQQLRYEHIIIPEALCYHNIAGLSTEARQQLSANKPSTIGSAARLPGITPAAVSLLLIYLKKHYSYAARATAS